MLKKIISVFLAVVSICTCTNVVFAQDMRKGADLMITDIRINNPYFRTGDDIRFEVDLKNIGDEVCNSGWVYFKILSGAKSRDGQNSLAKWSKRWLYPGDEITWSFIDYVAESDVIDVTVLCNSANNIIETNSGNNKFSRQFKSLKSMADMEVTDIKITPTDFSAGDIVSAEIFLENKGNADIPYSEIDGELIVNNHVREFKTVQELVSGEEISFTINGIETDSDYLDIEAEVNIEHLITEGDYANNLYSKNVYSIKEIDYDWDTVRIGGGGYVPHMELHNSDSDAVYIGTDVGGAYRYDHSTEEWICISDSLIFEDSNYAGIQGIETDPKNSDIVYVSCGSGASGDEGILKDSGIFRSNDKGKTWHDMNLPAAIMANNTKSYQNTLAVDPNNSNILYVVCPLDGLYRTKNAKAKVPVWEKLNLPGFERTSDVNKMMKSVVIDPSEVSGGKSTRIYAASPQGIFLSTDGGMSFALLEGSPTNATMLQVTSDGSLYAKTSMAEGCILKYDGLGWKSIAPYMDREYNSFSVNPYDEKMIVATTVSDIFFTDNAGLTWRSARIGAEKEFQAPWHPDSYFANYISFIHFDPTNNKTVWFGDWFGVWKTEDITEAVPKWKSVIRGLEEFCIRTIKPTTGKARIFIGAMDNNGVTSEDVFDFPEYQFDNPWCQDTNGIDFAEKTPDIVVRVGGKEWGSGPGDGGYSTDGGFSWTPFETYPLKLNNSGQKANNGFVAVAAEPNDDGIATILSTPINHFVYRSTDYGKNWSKIESLPQGLYADFNHYNEPIEADTVNKNIFYAYDANTGNFYLSKNNGESFAVISKLPKSDYRHYILSVPGEEGHVYAAVGGEGIYYSENYGATFKKLNTVTGAVCFSIGKESPLTGCATLYIYGTVNGVNGIYRSQDKGSTWERIKSVTENMLVEPDSLKADRKDFGMIYMVKSGRGVRMGIPSDLDIKPPRVVVNTKLNGQTIKDKKLTIVGTATEPSAIYCTINGSEYTVETDSQNKFTIDVILQEGENTAVFYAVDKKGYKSNEVSYSFKHDPKYVGLVVDQSSGVCIQKSFTITGTVNGGNKSNLISINGEKISVNPKTKKFSYTAAIEDGINMFKITAWDDEGNTTSKILEMDYDKIAPSVTFHNAGITTNNVLYLLSGTVSEPCSITVGEYTHQIQSGDSLDFVIPLQLNTGENTFYATMTDPAGNTSNTSVNVIYNTSEKVPEAKNVITVYNTSGAVPTIDGKLDDGEWYLNRVASKVLSGATSVYSVFGMKGDSKYLYFAARVYDKNINPGGSSEYNMDSIELFFDPELNRADKYDTTDHQIRLALKDEIRGLKSGADYKIAHSITDDGYIIESAIPWESVDLKYASGAKFGFDVSLNDNNLGEGTTRDGALGWVGTANNYRDTSAFGTAVIE